MKTIKATRASEQIADDEAVATTIPTKSGDSRPMTVLVANRPTSAFYLEFESVLV